jgi:hypothetical protein
MNDTILWGVAGIVVTLLVGLAARYVIKKTRSQKQIVGKAGIGIQSGRDTRINGGK